MSITHFIYKDCVELQTKVCPPLKYNFIQIDDISRQLVAIQMTCPWIPHVGVVYTVIGCLGDWYWGN